MTGDCFFYKILRSRILRWGNNFISLHCSSKASLMPSATHLSSSGQHYHANGYPRRHRNNIRHATHTRPPWPATNALAGTCPGAEPPCPGTVNEGRAHVIKTMGVYGPIAPMVQQCPQPFGHTYIIWKANDGPPNPSTILPSYG
jgi:hypothetical protein